MATAAIPASSERVKRDAPWWAAPLMVWLLMSAFTFFALGGLQEGAPRGPDDLMRLVQVRDWLGGQAWNDVSQHRLAAPTGAPMHWSRLVDLPLAAAILVLRPFVGSEVAETAALFIVPLLTALAILLAGSVIIRRVTKTDTWLFPAALFLAATPLVAIQASPFRIDHHGWQIACGLAAIAAMLGRSPLKSGALAGLFMALWLQIGIEGLPIAVAIGGVLALRTLAEPAETPRFLGYLGSLAAVSTLLFAVTQPAAMWSESWCDAMMPAYFAALGAATLGALPLAQLKDARLPVRVAILGFAAMLGFAALYAIEPACAAGPFAQLDPLVQDYWYASIPEGRPLTEATAPVVVTVVAQLLVGAIGYGVAVWRTRSRDWMMLAALFAASALIGLVVMRASAFAAAMAVPGTVYLLSLAMPRATSVRPPWRIFAMAAVIFALFPMTPMAVYGAVAPPPEAEVEQDEANASCRSPDAYAPLNGLQGARILAPLDAGPSILYATPHSVVGSNHHRANAAIADTLRAFMGSRADARALFERRGLTHLVFCDGMKELKSYAESEPDAFAAQLLAGDAPEWLAPVAMPEDTPLRVYAYASGE